MTICIVVGSITIIICISISHLFQSKAEIIKPSKISRSLLKFLEEADNAYMAGYTKSRVDLFAEYMTPELCEILHEEMEQGEKKLFGPKDSGTRQWYLMEDGYEDENDIYYTVKKILIPKKIKQGSVSISLGEYIEEIWTVAHAGGSYIVCDII